jgi:hypothetical protein
MSQFVFAMWFRKHPQCDHNYKRITYFNIQKSPFSKQQTHTLQCIGLHQMGEYVSVLTYASVCDRLIFLARGCRSVLTTIYWITPRYTSGNDRDKSQAFIRRIFTTEALVQLQSSGICAGQNVTETGLLPLLVTSLSVSFRQGSVHNNSSVRDAT